MGLYEAGPCEFCGDLIYPAVGRTRWAPHGLKAIDAKSGSVHYCEIPEGPPMRMKEPEQRALSSGLDWSKESEELPEAEGTLSRLERMIEQ